MVKSHKPMACIQLFTNKPCIQSQGNNDEHPIAGAVPRADPNPTYTAPAIGSTRFHIKAM